MFKDISQKSDLLERHTPVCLTPRVPPPPPGIKSSRLSRSGNIVGKSRPVKTTYGAKWRGTCLMAVTGSTVGIKGYRGERGKLSHFLDFGLWELY